MPAVILESAAGSEYGDTPSSYEFPRRYLKLFQHDPHEPLYAVIYEPRGDDGRGRMRYVGWAEITGEPVPTGRTSSSGQDTYVVHYSEPAWAFTQDVPREVMGTPIETWLAQIPRGRSRNVATFGKAVRRLDPVDFGRILEFAGAQAVEVKTAPTDVRERIEVLTSKLKRDERFRRSVISSYDEMCAVSGFALGPVSVTRSMGLLDAAHIRPVAHDGSDQVSNGMPLTPTLHRMFDAGLFTAEYSSGSLRLIVSPRLERRMLESPDGRHRLDLKDGLVLRVPHTQANWPDRRQLEFHRAHVFQAG